MELARPCSGLPAWRVAVAALGLGWATVKMCAEEPAGKPPGLMEAFKVDEAYMPKLSFGLSLDVWKDNATGKVMSIVVKAVKPGSDAELAGIVAGTKIYEIDGRPVQDFAASFMKRTELNVLLVNRKNLATVVLEIGVPGEGETRKVTVTERHDLNVSAAREWERLTHP